MADVGGLGMEGRRMAEGGGGCVMVEEEQETE